MFGEPSERWELFRFNIWSLIVLSIELSNDDAIVIFVVVGELFVDGF